MSAKLLIVWDYDTALGQINSSFPYNFKYDPIYQEIENVEKILLKAKEINVKMTFACVGFAAEKGVMPFNNPEQIRKIQSEGHEIASHSWKHEWFPYLTDKQIFKSLERSKYALEECLGLKNSVTGFVPPHSRPMSWYKKFSISFGDRGFYPLHKGSDMGFILKQMSILEYKWCRVLKNYKPVWEKIAGSGKEDQNFYKWEIHDGIVCVPQHYTGFDEFARKYLEKAVEQNETLVIVGHPAALSRDKSESEIYFNEFMGIVRNYSERKKLEVMTVSDYIKIISEKEQWEIKIEIIPYSDELVKMHEEFSVKLWPAKKRRRSEIYNRWKFRGPENGTVDGLLLAVYDNKIAGQLGLIPVKLISGGKEYKAQWACDLIVDHDHRKSGIGNKLFKAAMDRDMITLGNNPSPKADVLMTKAGFKPFKCGRLMVFPIDPGILVKWAVPNKFSAINPVIASVIKPYFRLKKNNILKTKTDFYICELNDIDQLISQRQKIDSNPQIRHDKEFLEWRASGFLNYFPKLKTIMSSKGSYALYSHFGVNFNIYEWHCADEADFKSMCSYLFNECGKENTDIVQAVANSAEEMKWLSNAGFIKSRNDEKVIYYAKEDLFKDSDKFYFTLYDTDLNL